MASDERKPKVEELLQTKFKSVPLARNKARSLDFAEKSSRSRCFARDSDPHRVVGCARDDNENKSEKQAAP